MRRMMLLLVSALACFALVQAAPAYAYTCSPGDVDGHFAVGGNDTPAGYANKGDLLVNDFAEHQNYTWRAIGIFENQANLVEMGWYIDEGVDQNAHPYKSWVNNTVKGTANWPGNNIQQGQNSYVEFGVRDQDDNDWYNFIFDGNQSYGDPKFASISVQNAFALSESESFCSGDSLRARFTTLRAVHALNGGWGWYHSLTEYINTSYLVQWSYANENGGGPTTYHVCDPPACSF